MRVLVTGGAGFIGANLVARMLEEDAIDSVAVVDDLSTGEPDRLAGFDHVDLHKGSVLDSDLLRDAADGCDAIVHLAALASVPESLDHPLAYHEVNGTGTLNVLDTARRHGSQVILASSAAVYGQDPPLPTSESLPPQPASVYASSKLAAEAHALAYGNAFDLPVLVFRFFNVFGPLQDVGHTYAAVVPAFVSAAVSGEPLVIFGDGEQTRDMVPVGSVASVLTDAVVRRVTHNGPVNLAFGTRRSLLDIVADLEQMLDRPLDRRHQPARAGDVRHSQADHRLLQQLFGELAPPDFAAELHATVEWFQGRRTVGSPYVL